MTRSLLHDALVEVVDEVVAVGSNDLVSLLEGLVGGFVSHVGEFFGVALLREMIFVFGKEDSWKDNSRVLYTLKADQAERSSGLRKKGRAKGVSTRLRNVTDPYTTLITKLY